MKMFSGQDIKHLHSWDYLDSKLDVLRWTLFKLVDVQNQLAD